ncbi:MAG: IS3 family transposase [Fibrobacterota bacterium]|nr:MAG: IS3 family transposase [Fibrobacterota bacterium]
MRQLIVTGFQDSIDLGCSKTAACAMVGFGIRRLQRWQETPQDRRRGGIQDASQPLTEQEKDLVVESFQAPKYRDLPVRSAWVKMLDDDICLCSPATVFRVLDERDQKGRLTVRRASPQRRPPVLEATAVDQVWTWDITYLPSPVRGAYFYLYTIQDMFSRKAVGWTVELSENGELAHDLFARSIVDRVSHPTALRVHSDNGSPMRATRLTGFFEKIEVRYTHSRPHVSDDNAFIESLFATLKGRASFPEYFRTLDEARAYVDALMAWYNGEHMHSRLDYLTPDQMDQGKGPEIQAKRNAVLTRARGMKPNRFGSRSLCLRVPNSVKLTFHEAISYT